MQNLPIELQEEVLLSLREPKDLYQACSSSRQNRQICSASAFWREKFRRENLPLLEEGNNLSQWLNIYRKSLAAAKRVDKRMLSGYSINISLTQVDDPKILLPLGREEEITYYWNIMKASDHVQKSRYYKTIHGYTIEFFPGSGANSRYELVDNYEIENHDPRYGPSAYTVTERKKLQDGTVSTEDLWFILFQLAYSSKYNL